MRMVAFGGMALLVLSFGTFHPARAQAADAPGEPGAGSGLLFSPAAMGAAHPFRLGSCPRVRTGGQLRFSVGGRWFWVVGPLPGYGEVKWDDDDDVYIDYFKGDFHLFRLKGPGGRAATLVPLG